MKQRAFTLPHQRPGTKTKSSSPFETTAGWGLPTTWGKASLERAGPMEGNILPGSPRMAPFNRKNLEHANLAKIEAMGRYYGRQGSFK